MRRPVLIAALFFLAVALFLLRGVLPDPSGLLPRNAEISGAFQLLGESDQAMVLYLVARNADALLHNPAALRGEGQCLPFPQAYTLGEHLFGEGLLAVVPWALTGDPILTYNILLLLTFFLPGFTTFLLVRHFTRNDGAALVAGLLVQLVPSRIIDGGHPMLHADYWLPLALLCLHRLFTTGRVAAALGAALFLSLTALETIYIIFGTVILIGVWVGWLLLRAEGHRMRAFLLTCAAGALVVAVGLVVLLPYLDSRAAFDVLSGRDTALVGIGSFGPGELMFSGWVFLGLIVAGLLDRLRGARGAGSDDPRLALLLAALLILWASTDGIPVPGTTWKLASPVTMLRGIVPGIDAARGFFAMHVVAWVPLAVIAGYGAVAIGERLPARLVPLALVSCLAAILVGRIMPGPTALQFGTPLRLAAHEARPSEEQIALLRSEASGSAVDLPTLVRAGMSHLGLPEYFRLHAFAPRPVAACYNSFGSPYVEQMHQLVKDLPAPAAAEALAALGVETLLMRPEQMLPAASEKFDQRLQGWRRAKLHVELRGEADGLHLFRLHGSRPVREDPAQLGAGPAWEETVEAARPVELAFWFANRSRFVFRAPSPLGYREARVLWTDEGGAVVGEESHKILLPVALGPKQAIIQRLAVDPPQAPGHYRGWILLPDVEHPIAGSNVRVRAADGASGAGESAALRSP